MPAEEFLDEPDFDAVRRVRLEYIHAPFVGRAPSPILLEFEEKLQRGDRYRPRLEEPRYRPFVGLNADVAAGVSRNVDLIAGTEKIQRREKHARFGPKPGHNEFFLPALFDSSPEIPVEPGIDGSSVDGVLPGKMSLTSGIIAPLKLSAATVERIVGSLKSRAALAIIWTFWTIVVLSWELTPENIAGW